MGEQGKGECYVGEGGLSWCVMPDAKISTKEHDTVIRDMISCQ
jgi:hypothetical protein